MAIKKSLALYGGDIKELQSGDTADTGKWLLLKKTADENKGSNTTLANDNTLFFTMLANTKYRIQLKIHFEAPATPGFKFALSFGTATTSLVRIERQLRAPAATAYTIASDTAATASTAVTGNAATNGYLEIDMIIQVSGTGGVFGFQWAQSVSSATVSTVRAGSILEYMTT
jgi:hypothetical protein